MISVEPALLRQGPRPHTPDPGEKIRAYFLSQTSIKHIYYLTAFLDHDDPFFCVVFHFVLSLLFFSCERKPCTVAVRQDLIISVAYPASNKADVKYFTEQILLLKSQQSKFYLRQTMGRIRLEQVKPNQLTKLRDINQKLFPILSISESSDEFSDIFTDEDRGFAFIAYYSDMTVRSQKLGK